MNEQVFQERFALLLKRINALPDEQKLGLASPGGEKEVCEGELSKAVDELQDSIDFLRLSVKYLMFDLEATRRENAYLRRLLEQATRRDQEIDQELEEDNFYRDDEEE
ncbi:MAG: hypothetical protein MK089_11840 [Phycisphaerales bacterium]|nr:hypothetical protein [Phycisphaerae bacterium]MCH2154021.1 hypothetical protein [Phycisphaerales bacterium]|tara:strand:- start:223 stop:546 length:324 start_codon:yes stop_codon:yes gene_type:complete